MTHAVTPTSETSDSAGTRRLTLLTALLLLALCVAAFANAAPREFTYDSTYFVRDHELLSPEQPWSRIWTSNYWHVERSAGLYRPITISSFRVEKRWLGFENPAAFARTNLVLHAVVVLLLWRLARRWIGSGFAATVAAALYAVHPVATEVIPNLVGRADLIAAAGALGALLAWDRAGDRDRTGIGWVCLALLCWLVGVLGKESAVVFPVIALVRDRARLATWRDVLAKRWWAYSGVAVVGVAWWCWRSWVVSQQPPVIYHPADNPILLGAIDQRWMTAIHVLGLYVRLTLFPLHLSADYSYNQVPLVSSPMEPRYLVSMAALLALAVIGVVTWRRKISRPIALGLAFFFIALLPVSNLLLVIGTIMADRLAYLPAAGMCIALGGAAALARQQWQARHARVALWCVAGVLIGLLLVRTHLRNPTWRDQESLWLQTVRDAPYSSRAHTNAVEWVGASLPPNEKLLMEGYHNRRALEILEPLPPIYSHKAISNLAGHYIKLAQTEMDNGGLTDAARDHLVHAVEVLRGVIAMREEPSDLRDRWQATHDWEVEHGRTPSEPRFGSWTTFFNLGSALYLLGEYEQAIEPLQVALEMHPEVAMGWSLLGRCYANVSRLDDAEAPLVRATELAPDIPDHYRYLARVRLLLGRYGQALEAIDTAVELHDSELNITLRSDVLRAWLAALREAGDDEAAAQLIERAKTQYNIDLEDTGDAEPP